ncbi:NUDIX domain-containing protein [Estrella lausannensis]|uniref:Nudix hydrolase n=1 Tax=Estrella lausannensis TaxID=483423 RepID=A0A0H5E610_9BACT|nr:NUDIX domain-containing protein [Estrella lausannensis]CRX38680.1 Nudix hydrolase [Estrella lausannensis]
MKRQFVASAYVVENQKVLLLMHKKLKKWLPPGGHLDENELPHEGAQRETLEETGIEIEIISDDLSIRERNARIVPKPRHILLEEIPAHHEEPQHQHIDFIFLARPIGGTLTVNRQESDALRWFSEDELDQIPENEIFNETKTIAKNLIATLLAT